MTSPQPRVEVHNHYDMHGMPGMQGMHCRHGGFGSMMAGFGGAMAFGLLGSMMGNPGFGFGFGSYPRFY